MRMRAESFFLLTAMILSGELAVADTVVKSTSKASAEKLPAADAVARINAALAAKTEAQFLDTQLGDAVNHFELMHRIDIELDIAALSADGKGSETIINSSLKDLTLASTLTLILKPHGLTWTVADEVIIITTKSGEAAYVVTSVYSVAELADADGQVDYEEITKMLTQSVEPDSWREAGGSLGTIARISAKKSLVVTQTHRNHKAIAAILKQFGAK